MGYWQAFLSAPLTPRESEAMGCGQKSLPGLLLGSWERFPFEGWAEQFCFSFQTPIRASEFIKRSDNLTYFVSVKGNVDAVQSRAASA